MGLSTARRCGAIGMVSCALLAAGAARASADLAPGTWTFDGRVSELVRDPATGAVFAGGTFTREQAPLAGLFTTGADGDGTAQPLRAVDGAVTAVAADGHGGWYLAWTHATAFTQTSGMLHVTAGGAADPAFDPAPDGPVSSLVVAGSTVYASGPFTHIGGAARSGLAALDAGSGRATAWDPGAPDGPVFSLAVAGSTVYAGGDFAQWAGQPRHDLAAVDAATGALTAFDPDVDGFGVDALEVSGSTVYAGGNFATIGGQARRNLGAVDATTGAPTAWSPQPDDYVLALAVADGTVYAGGWFHHIGGAARNGVAALSATGAATAWDARLDTAFIGAVAVSGSVVYVGGGFSSAGGRDRTNVAALDAATGDATAWDPEPNGDVSSLAVGGGRVAVAGGFAGAGPPLARVGGLAKLRPDGTLDTSWHPDPEMTQFGDIAALALGGSTLYAAGDFTAVGGAARAGLAAVDTATGAVRAWQPAATGGSVFALAATGSSVVLGGNFTAVDGAARAGLAGVDAGTGALAPWSADAQGGAVTALAAAGSVVYAGGPFTSLGGVERHHFAALDAGTGAVTGWNPDGSLNAPFGVQSLVAAGGVVYAAGTLGQIGGLDRGGLAQLDAVTGAPTSWLPDGSGGPGGPLAVDGSTVFAGGLLGLAAIDAAGHATPVFSGAGPVLALAASPHAVYVGGAFTELGGRATGPFAVLPRDTAPPAVTPIPIPTPTATPGPPPAATPAPAKPKAKRISTAALRRALTPSGKAARIGRLRARGAYALRFTTPVAGRLTIRWLHGRTLVASGHATLTRPGTRTAHIRLTRAGRRLLRHARRIELTGRATFAGVSVRRTFTLRL